MREIKSNTGFKQYFTKFNVILAQQPVKTNVMEPIEFSIRIAYIVEAIRESKGIKQYEMADALGIDRSNYSRAETGQRPFNVIELKTIADTLNISVGQIILLALGSTILDDKFESISDLLANFVLRLKANSGDNQSLSEAELELVIRKLLCIYKGLKTNVVKRRIKMCVKRTRKF